MEKNKLSGKDLDQLKEKGISLELFRTQLYCFNDGFPYADLCDSAKVGNGIFSLSATELSNFRKIYEEQKPFAEIVKFVPASGAATRMFKDLYSTYNNLKEGKNKPLSKTSKYFFDNISKFAFYETLEKNVNKKYKKEIKELLEEMNYLPILSVFLENGMAYGQLPKALILFHKYGNRAVTAMEEHFEECAQYAASSHSCNLHFTISEEHKHIFLEKVMELKPVYEKKFGLKYNIHYSIQKSSTDTIAVTLHDEIFRDENQKMVFRPAGHGALIENLNEIEADIVFIKNIDNITTSSRRDDTIVYKEALCGLLIDRREKIFEILRSLRVALKERECLDCLPWDSWLNFIRDDLQIRMPIEFKEWSLPEQGRYIFQILNRPIRVCGMVKNEGEPGGGPFWVARVKTFYDKEISEDISFKLWPVESLQIVESSQINHEIEEQENIFKSSTHFNPVDLICSLKDFNNKIFNLKDFIDPMTAFISQKSVKGTDIKAMELPGLWNGAMADWITLFVEEPISVFTPVKTVNDLLREVHQV